MNAALASSYGQVFFMVPHEPVVPEPAAANDVVTSDTPVAVVEGQRRPERPVASPKPSVLEHQPVEPKSWLSVTKAAAFLDMTPDALRRALERHAAAGRDGVLEARLDGVRGRKLAGRWKVQLGPAWASYGDDERLDIGGRGTSRRGPKPAARPERNPV
jgi:hypothetical protein